MRQSVSSFFIALIVIGITLLCPVTYTSVAEAAQLSEYLDSTLSSKNNSDFVSVLVFMNDRVDVSSMQQRYKLAGFTRQASHKILIDELQSYARTAQTDIIRALDDAKSRGDVRSYETYWITNAMQIEATKSYIESLRQRPDVAAIIADIPMQSLYYPAGQSTSLTPVGLGVSPGLRAIHADAMWALGYTGAGSLIASFDSGVDGDHPALKNSYHGNNGFPANACWFDPVFGETYPHWESIPGGSGPHGTQTMGVMVGKDDATGDTVGVAWGADWISAMVVDVPHSNYLEAFQWVADPDGDPNTVDDVPDVLNNSWGFTQSNLSCLDIFWEPIDNVEAAGTVVIFSCGNSGPAPMTLRNPANRATTPYNTFSVGAVWATAIDTIWNGSSRGPSDCDGISIKPEVVAPGYRIRTTYPGSSYNTFDGTSFSGPHVAGAVALLRQYNPNAPVDSIKSALMRSAVDKGDLGEDNTFGWGVIDIPAAMALLAPNNKINIYVQQVTHNPIEPGDTVNVVVQLRNSGFGTLNVAGELANPQTGATILQGFSSFGDMNLNVSKDNSLNPYRIAFASSITEGTRLTIDLQIRDGASYQRTIRLYFTVGTALVKSIYNHQTDSCRFTISNYGTYGLASESVTNKGGVGFAFPSNGTNYLFQCGLMIGTDSNHVSDGVVNKLGSVDEDFAVTPGGNLTEYIPGVIGDVETRCRYADDRAANPLGLVLEQRTANFTNSADARYVIIEYVISNKSAMPINGAYVGIFCDWDFPWGSGGSDRTGFSREYGLGYLYQNGPVANSFRGTAVLNPEGVQTFYAIRNSGLVYDGSGSLVTEARKYGFLTHGFADTASLSPYDQSYCISTGPFNIAPGASDTACFVMMGGRDVTALQSAVSSARARYRQATPVDDGGEPRLPSTFELEQNFPNPFNPETVISYTLRHADQVSVAIYNLLGQQIATLVDERQNAGYYSITWDGRDHNGRPVASGVYFYRLKAGDTEQTKKMILLK
jgi:subtilisin family serine protease